MSHLVIEMETHVWVGYIRACPWDEHLRRLTQDLRRNGAQVNVIEE